MINDIIEVKNIFDKDANDFFIRIVSGQRCWSVDSDSNSMSILKRLGYDTSISEECSDTGMLLTSFLDTLPDHVNDYNSNLNDYAYLILEVALAKASTKIKFEGIRIKRYLWNYYNRSSCGYFHNDYSASNHCSVVYYLNTCDGYTQIDDKKIYSEAGKCIFFDSHIGHKGVGPKKDKKRFVLNIAFEYQNIIRLEDN